MKVLMINESPHRQGNTYVALHEMEKIFAEAGIETEKIRVISCLAYMNSKWEKFCCCL